MTRDLSSNPVFKLRNHLADITTARDLSSNPVFHSRTKHIEIAVHFIRDKVLAEEIEVKYICTEEQNADILSKPLVTTRFHYLKDKLTVEISPQFRLKGAVENITKLDSKG